MLPKLQRRKFMRSPAAMNASAGDNDRSVRRCDKRCDLGQCIIRGADAIQGPMT